MKVDLEGGYLKIANGLLDSLMRAPLSPSEMSVALCVLRQTYGYRGPDGRPKKTDLLAGSRLAALTGLRRPTAATALMSLEKRMIVVVARRGAGATSRVGIQTDTSLWPSRVSASPDTQGVSECGQGVSASPDSNLSANADTQKTRKTKRKTASSTRPPPGEAGTGGPLTLKQVEWLKANCPQPNMGGRDPSVDEVQAWFAAKVPVMRGLGHVALWKSAINWFPRMNARDLEDARKLAAISAMKSAKAEIDKLDAEDAPDNFDEFAAAFGSSTNTRGEDDGQHSSGMD